MERDEFLEYKKWVIKTQPKEYHNFLHFPDLVDAWKQSHEYENYTKRKNRDG